MLELENLSFRYSRRKPLTLDDFSLSLAAGGVYGLLGPNGAGKSTLLQLIAGMLTPERGCAKLYGVDTRRRLPETMAQLFLVPEEFSLPPVSLHDYIRLNARFYPRFSADDLKKYLEIFDLDADLRLNALSMGQKKKVFMCFAMSCNTPLLLMDEPTNGLDIPGKSAFRRFVAQSLTDDRLFIISTHQVRDIEQLLDHILIMNTRKIVLDRGVADIQRRLKFMSQLSSQPAEALYAMKNVLGIDAILPNTDGDDTDINLELLFNFALEHPDLLTEIFSEPAKTL